MKELTKIQKSKLSKLESTSSKIRYLSDLNLSRSEIKNILNIRYQFVRNVLVTYELKKENEKLRNK